MGKDQWSRSGYGETQTHHVGISPQENQLGAKSPLGKAEWSNAEAKTHHVGSGPETDRGGFTCTLGGVPSSEEEGGVGRA